jgi:hypothetical protein
MKLLALCLSVLLYQVSGGSAWGASSETPFYAGKTITIMRGGGPGGFGDMQTSVALHK